MVTSRPRQDGFKVKPEIACMNTHETDIAAAAHDIHAIAGPSKQQVRLEAAWATHAEDVQAAQRLRHHVFAGEMGASITPLPGTPAGLDVDCFDAHCEHLLVRTVETTHTPSEVVGTYRVLPPDAALRTGGLSSETEFDLTPPASGLTANSAAFLPPDRPLHFELGPGRRTNGYPSCA
jgi:putative hemolysin